MNSDLDDLRGQGFLPFQAHFILEFLDERRAPVWELASPPGTGKVHLSTEIVRRILDRQVDARVLILAPAALTMQWEDRLAALGLPAMLVDRRRFIELAASGSQGQPVWPSRIVAVMSMDLAKRPDILPTLHQVEWDLLLADESHLLAGKRADAFFGLLASRRARRGLMLTSLPTERSYPGPLSFSRKTVTLRDIVDWNNRPVFEPRQPPLEIVPYIRGPEEVTLLRKIEELATHLATTSPIFRFHADLLVRAAASSSYAAQRVGWRLRNGLTHARNLVAHGRSIDLTALTEPELDLDPLERSSPEPSIVSDEVLLTLLSHVTVLDSILAGLDELSDDPKLDTLKRILVPDRNDFAPSHVCVWIQFQATAQYLAAALEDLRITALHLQASMVLSERTAATDRFKATGGVLLVTGAAIEGLELGFVEQCVHYDLPLDRRALEQRIGRFLRLGRTKPFRSIALRDTSGALSWEQRVFQDLNGAQR